MHVRRSQAENCRDNRAEDVVRGDHEQSHRAILPFRQRRDLSQHAPFGGRRGGVTQAVGTGIHAEQPDRHHDDVSIARRLQCRRDMGERMRVADEDQNVARTSVHLVERKLGRRQDVEDVSVVGDGHRRTVAAASGEEHEEAADERDCGDGRRIAADEHRQCRGAGEDRRCEQPQRNLSRADVQVQRRLERPRGRTQSPQPHEGRDLERQGRDNRHGVGMRQPRDASGAYEHDEDGGGHGDVDGSRGRTEPRVEEREPLRQRALD